MELIHSLCLRIETIHWQFSVTISLLSIIQLMPNMDAFFVSYPLQPLNCHAYRTFGFEVVFRQPS